MIKILVWDEAGNVTERKAPKAGQIATDGGINISIDNTRGDVDIHHTGHTTEMGKEPPPEKRKSVSQRILFLALSADSQSMPLQ